MRGRLLERECELAEIADAAREAIAGAGSLVLVHGEAGIGKSSLVEEALAEPPLRVLTGRCDDLATPRTLGPFRDLAGQVGAGLTRAARDPGGKIFDAVLAELDSPVRPTALVVEDVHWADDATLDVLAFLVRRIHRLPALLLLTYRDDDAPALRRLLGHASAARRVHRLRLSPLSADAVGRLSAGTGHDADRLHRVTLGNPFFVAEVLADGGGDRVPETVVDAVRARVARLDPATRDAVEQLAVVPSTVDHHLLDALLPAGSAGSAGAAGLVEAERIGILDVSPTGVAFRHELTRRAIADSLPAARRVAANRRVLAALDGRGEPDAVLHHAAEAGDRDAIVRYGPDAAGRAARAGAHRQAAAHYRLVLRHRDLFPPAERAALLAGYAAECATVGDASAAVAAQRDAVALLRGPYALGEGLCQLSRMCWRAGDRAGAEETAARAAAILETAGDPRLFAAALANQARLHMLGDRSRECVAAGTAAIALARSVDDDAVLADALCTVGTSLWCAGDPDGRPTLEDSLRMALAGDLTATAVRAYTNLIGELIDHVSLDEAEPHLRAAIALAERGEELDFRTALAVEQGRLLFARGRWEEAARAVRPALDGPAADRCVALIVRGRIAARRGDHDADPLLAEAWRIAVVLGEAQHLAPAAAARAEAACLRGDDEAALASVAEVYDDLGRFGYAVPQTQLAYWSTRAGKPATPLLAGHPYGLQATGRGAEAAAAWLAAGCPYEHAAALAESPDVEDRLAALPVLDQLGAEPLARLVRAGLREADVPRIPRGPRRTTRANPAGLTGRQAEVLRLLGEGLTNPEIAARLVLSTRTVDSHVAAIFDKLGVRSRREAAAFTVR